MTRQYLLLILFLILYSCQKQKPQPIIYYPIDTGLLRDFNYKPGSYWVYSDSITGNIDSFVVVKKEMDSVELITGFKEQSLYYLIKIHIDEYRLGLSSNSLVGTLNWQLMDRSAYLELLDIGVYNSPLFSLPFKSDTLDGGGEIGGHFTITSMLFPSIILAGKSYSDVLEVHHRNDLHDDLFYINQDKGIIKMRLNNSPDHIFHIWELQRYNIVR